MAESRITAASATSPPHGQLAALGIVDLSDANYQPGTSSAKQQHRDLAASSKPHSATPGSTAADHQPPNPSVDSLGLPTDSQVVRVPDGHRYRVRAVYDFEATDESALSFNAGDVIEVLTMLPSGWWDGMLGTSRGWFPSNYVEDVEEGDFDAYMDDDYAVEMAPDGRVIARNGAAAADIMGLDGRLDGEWDEWDGQHSQTGLEDLALELMEDPRPARQSYIFAQANDATDTRRQRRRTDASRRDTADFSAAQNDPDETLRPLTPSNGNGHGADAWVPSLTADGRVYYHNTQTGQDAWEIPETDLTDSHTHVRHDDDQSSVASSRGGRQSVRHSQNFDDSRDPRRLSSYDQARTNNMGMRKRDSRDSNRTSIASSIASRPGSLLRAAIDDPFRIPQGRSQALPAPWITRMADDGRTWLYFNQVTGEVRREPPTGPVETVADLPPRRASIGATAQAQVQPRSTHRRTQTDWEGGMRPPMAPAYTPSKRPTMTSLIDKLNESIRDVYDAGIAGAAAEEELALARDMQGNMATAVLHDENAVERVTAAQQAVIDAVRNLVVAFGYVGPILPPPGGVDSVLDDMVRPKWSEDVSIVGGLGILIISTHAVISGSRVSDAGESAWDNVLRACTKLRGIVDGFPNLALSEMPVAVRDTATGRQLAAWFGADAVGDFLSGRFGFGTVADPTMRVLDQATVVDIQKLKAEVDAVIRAATAAPATGVLDIIRTLARFRDAVSRIDVATSIDLDGEPSNSSQNHDHHQEDLRIYADLVGKARLGLRDLDLGALALDSTAADVYLRSETPGLAPSIDALSQAVATVFRSVSGLLVISQQQLAIIDHGSLRGQFGQRSPAAIARKRAAAHARTQSVASFDSQRSIGSRDLQRLREIGHKRQSSMASSESKGTEQEFLGDEDQRASEGTRPTSASNRASQSASASQTSLARRGDASSSSTSLAYQQDSETGSLRNSSNRSSILKAVPSFLRNRSGSESAESKKASKKLAKLLGDESVSNRQSLPPQPRTPASQPPTPAPTAPPPTAIGDAWYLDSDYKPGEIVMDARGAVRAGTIRALVERLTPHTSADTSYFQQFLLTYRSFVKTDELVALLIERYHIEPPANLTEAELQQWRLRKQTPIRLRVANTLKAWLDNHYVEERDAQVLPVVEEFATVTLIANGSELLSKQLRASVDRRRKGNEPLSRRITMSTNRETPTILPLRNSGKTLTILDIPPLEFARQLTIIESTSYQRIKAAECVNKAWHGDPDGVNAPNVGRCIFIANNISEWVALTILKPREPKMRATMLKFWIRVAAEARALNNFSSMAAVVAGLGNSSISRLKRSWDLVSEKTMREFAALEKTMDSTKNFQKYKEMLKSINPPCVPFLGFFLSALTFIEDGNKDMVYGPPVTPAGGVPLSMTSSQMSSATNGTNGSDTPNGRDPAGDRPLLINFFKRQLTAETVRDIQQYQSQPYNLAASTRIQHFIEAGLDATSKREGRDLYELSVLIEPKDESARRTDSVSVEVW